MKTNIQSKNLPRQGARSSRSLFALKVALLVVGLHSICLGLLVFGDTKAFYQFFFSSPPRNVFFVRQSGLFLILMGLFYLIPLKNVHRFKTMVSFIVASKGAAVIFLLANAHLTPSPAILYLAAAGDGAMAVVLSVLSFYGYRSDKKPGLNLDEDPNADFSTENGVEEDLFAGESPARISAQKEIQRSLFATESCDLPSSKEIGTHVERALAPEWGGDFHDFISLNRDRFCFFLGHAFGKEIDSALRTVAATTLIKSFSKADSSPSGILSRLNEELARTGRERLLLSLFLGIVDVRKGELLYTNASMPSALLLRKSGGAEALDVRHGPPLGSARGMSYKESRASFFSGDQLLVMSNGLTGDGETATNPFAAPGQAGVLPSLAGLALGDAARKILEQALSRARGKREDDRTVFAVEFLGRPADSDLFTLEVTLANRLDEIDRLNEFWEGFADQGGLAQTVRRQMKIVFDEVLNNIISYAWDDGAEHKIGVSLELGHDRLAVSVVDDGNPFNPLAAESPDSEPGLDMPAGGMGIHLVRNVMDEVNYERRGSENILTLVKRTAVNDASQEKETGD